MPQTSSKQVVGYLLRYREDLLLNSTFAEILSSESFFEVKLPTKLEQYKYKPILHFGNLLQFDLVKTRKHWIVRHVEKIEGLDTQAWEYHKFELLTRLNHLLCDNLHLDQECHLIKWLQVKIQILDQMKAGSTDDLETSFRKELSSLLGF